VLPRGARASGKSGDQLRNDIAGFINSQPFNENFFTREAMNTTTRSTGIPKIDLAEKEERLSFLGDGIPTQTHNIFTYLASLSPMSARHGSDVGEPG